MSNDTIAFDYHGYSSEENLLCHHGKVWRAPGIILKKLIIKARMKKLKN